MKSSGSMIQDINWHIVVTRNGAAILDRESAALVSTQLRVMHTKARAERV